MMAAGIYLSMDLTYGGNKDSSQDFTHAVIKWISTIYLFSVICGTNSNSTEFFFFFNCISPIIIGAANFENVMHSEDFL